MSPSKALPRRRLSEVINQALYVRAGRIIHSVPAEYRAELRERIAATFEDGSIYETISVEARADVRRGGRVDNRSGRLLVWIGTPGTELLCDPLIRELEDAEGNPIDAAATVRDLRAQLAHVPDHVPAEWLDAPHDGAQGQDEGKG